MSSLDTDLNVPPYYDDFDQDKRFHRVLFRPSVAVQARELTQLQTILQNQIERFGNHIFKDGSVVQGCSVEYISDLEYVGVEDQFSDDSDLSLDDERLVGAIAVGQTSDVQALVISTRSGFIRQNPGCLFVRYTKPGANNQRTFIAGEEIALYAEDASYVENIILAVDDAAPFAEYVSLVVDGTESANVDNVSAKAIITAVNTSLNTVTVNNVRRRFNVGDVLLVNSNNEVNSAILSISYELSTEIGRINTLTANTDGIAISNTQMSGFAYGAHVSDGIVYHKGHFIKVEPHNVIVNPISSDPSGYLLGFETEEEIVTETADSSLNDNALGYSNENAPGAHRLKLTSTVVSKAANNVSNTEIFFPIVEFSNTGVAFERTNPEYAALGDEIAKRTYEESGHYIIKPFSVSSNTDPKDAEMLIYDVSPGLAYVKGMRTELLTNLPIVGRRGTDTVSYQEQIVSTNYGNYIEVNEVRGIFATNGQSIVLRDAPQFAVSNNRTLTSTTLGTAIGSANIQDIVFVSGTKGAANSVYRMYLYNIKMSNDSLSFANTKSISLASSGNNFADVVLTGGKAVLQESSYAALIFDLGATAVKSLKDANNISDSNFYYTSANTSASLEAAGTINFRVPSGGGILGFSDGSDNSEIKVDLLLQANALSSDVATNVTFFANGVMQDTALGTKFYPGEVVVHGANTHLVTAVLGSTQIQVTPAPAALSAQTVQRFHYAGSVVPLDGSLRTLTIDANNEATIDLGVTYSNAPISATVRMYTRQNQGAEVKKVVNRSSVVMIEVANTGTDTGPWNLGIPDVFALRGVYHATGSGNSTSADLTANYVANYKLDNGQRDTHYDHATISLKPNLDPTEIQGLKLLVEFDHFVANNTTGKGFFSVDSYPVDDTLTANNAATINTYEIPTYYSSARRKTFDLRNVLDFRPYKTATANVTSNLRTATVNPTTINTFNAQTTGFKPYPGENFECNFTHYLGRKDVLTVTPAGSFVVVEGVADLNPRSPKYPSESLSIADIDVPPYPSLPDNERVIARRNDGSIKISVQNHKRFTMKDISALEQRISRLEYYTSLNALEKAATDMKVIGTGGLDRFKNGIFVDALNDHSFGRVDVPQYTVAIDEKNGYARPFFQPEFFDLEYDTSNSTNTKKIGNLVTIDYTEEAYIVQGYATDSRKLSGSPPAYNGTLILKPNRWSEVEVLAPPVAITATDKASVALRQMSAPQLCANYGWWRDDKKFLDKGTLEEETPANATLRSKTALGTENSYSVDDNTSQSVTIQSFLRPREVAFIAYGLKPYTKFYAYIDDIESGEYFASGDVVDEDEDGDKMVKRTSMWGEELESNSRGELEGKISIPAWRFKAGRHTVKLLSVEIDEVTDQQVSSAAALFEADIIYKKPPPPIIVKPPKPPVVPPPPKVPPTAKFSMSGKQYVTAPTNHQWLFTDKSVKGTGTITTWLWNFGDGTTYNGQTPPLHTYTVSNSSQTFTVSLTVTDSNGNTATYKQPLTLYKLQPAPPPAPPIPPPLPKATLSIQSYSNGYPTGGNESVGAGQAESTHVAAPSTTYVGAYFEWIINVNSGVALTTTTVANNTLASAGATGFANNRLSLSLVDPTPTETPLVSAATITCRYKYSNGYIIGAKSYNFTHKTTNIVQTPTPTPPRTRAVGGGGGCVAPEMFLDFGVQANEVQVGDQFKTMLPGSPIEVMPVVEVTYPILRKGVRIVTSSGAALRLSAATQFNLPGALEDLEETKSKRAEDMLGELVLVERTDGDMTWETVVAVEDLGMIEVVPISFGGRSFAAGETAEARIYSHNMVHYQKH